VETRERIIDTAIRLFNEEGMGPVSTNHIARALGISPGNLYYHFRNKEEIIRAIYARLRPMWEAAIATPSDRPPVLADLLRIITEHFRIVWEYRFYYRELPALMRRDPDLARQYQEVREAGLANVEAILRHFTAAGVLAVAEPDTALPELARVCWLLLADFWLPFAELGEDPLTPAALRQGSDLILRVLRPYLTPAALADLARLERDARDLRGASS
jgi:AcrR family transcriptional regulator